MLCNIESLRNNFPRNIFHICSLSFVFIFPQINKRIFINMQSFKHFDPQKLELLEARFKGRREQPIIIKDDSNQSSGSRSSNNDDIHDVSNIYLLNHC